MPNLMLRKESENRFYKKKIIKYMRGRFGIVELCGFYCGHNLCTFVVCNIIISIRLGDDDDDNIIGNE